MTFDEMHQAVKDAEATRARADLHVRKMADLCAGRLRKGNVSAYVLKKLKRELRDFNIHTGYWKD